MTRNGQIHKSRIATTRRKGRQTISFEPKRKGAVPDTSAIPWLGNRRKVRADQEVRKHATESA